MTPPPDIVRILKLACPVCGHEVETTAPVEPDRNICDEHRCDMVPVGSYAMTAKQLAKED